MENRYIGVDFNEDYTEMKVSVLYGLKTYECITYNLNRPEDMFLHLKSLAEIHNAKISFENNKRMLWMIFQDNDALYLLERNPVVSPCTGCVSEGFNLGITYTANLQGLWDIYKTYIIYPTEYENSSRIAALNMLCKPKFLFTVQRIKELEL